MLFKIWLKIGEIDVSLIISSNSLVDAIERAKNLANNLDGILKTVDNIFMDYNTKQKNRR